MTLTQAYVALEPTNGLLGTCRNYIETNVLRAKVENTLLQTFRACRSPVFIWERIACRPTSNPPAKPKTLRFFQEFFESSKVLHKELAYLRNAATSKLTILITGEIGTGKELVACAVHQLSPRSPRAFVRINCAAIEPQLVASELFGQRKGRQSPQAQPRLDWLPLAEGGTIFLKASTISPPRPSWDFCEFCETWSLCTPTETAPRG
jgi:transcriptional regulator of acetoin/glycerol metabolism